MQSMQEQVLYEYAVVRYVPRIEREEFINIGLVMMCKRKRWLRCSFNINEERIRALYPAADIALLRMQTESFPLICSGKGGTIGSFETHERFRWMTAVRSACISTSRPHPGLCNDLDATFDHLFAELVL